MSINLTSPDFALPAHEEDDLTFFCSDGFRKLMRAMLKQSIKDIVIDRKDAHAAAEVSASARWPQTPMGRGCIEFLMPGVTPERVIAKIYQDPQSVLDAMDRSEADSAQDAHVESAPAYTLEHCAALDAVDLALQEQGGEDEEPAIGGPLPWG